MEQPVLLGNIRAGRTKLSEFTELENFARKLATGGRHEEVTAPLV